MAREDFRQKVLEQEIFNELKDNNITSANYVRKKYGGLDIDYSRLYRRIVNYQIRTYGNSLNGSYEDSFTNQFMSKKIAKNACNRKNRRRNREQ